MKKIAIATTGGDAPGMNAAIRAVVRKATTEKIEVIGFKRGYAGLLENDFQTLDARSVGGIIHQGGTILKSSRSEKMKTKDGLSKASKILNSNNIDGLIVIGGNGSFKGACELYDVSSIPIVGIPATIDNDLSGTDTTIGFDTAVNTAVDAIDKIRDTATSHERIFIVEVMGRYRGFIALEVGISAGAEVIIVPEIECDIDNICNRLKESYRKGKESGIIVVAEGTGKCVELSNSIKKIKDFEVRVARLGHIQRGGKPTAYSRLLACRMGAKSIEILLNGQKKVMTGIQGSQIVPVDLTYASTIEKPLNKELFELAKTLAT